MGQPAFDEDDPFSGQQLKAAAVLCRTEHGNLHAGVLHRGSRGAVGILHLGWEDKLYNDWPWVRLWAAPEADPALLSAAAGLCRLVWKRYQTDRAFPYALNYCGGGFDEAGRLVLPDGSQGLTCATFILAVMESVGVTLVDVAGWPVRKDADIEFLNSVEDFASPAHLALLRAEVEDGARRVHPHEVLGACCVEDLPATFVALSPAAVEVLAKLDGHGQDAGDESGPDDAPVDAAGGPPTDSSEGDGDPKAPGQPAHEPVSE